MVIILYIIPLNQQIVMFFEWEIDEIIWLQRSKTNSVDEEVVIETLLHLQYSRTFILKEMKINCS